VSLNCCAVFEEISMGGKAKGKFGSGVRSSGFGSSEVRGCFMRLGF
jgi:hypothetical protein